MNDIIKDFVTPKKKRIYPSATGIINGKKITLLIEPDMISMIYSYSVEIEDSIDGRLFRTYFFALHYFKKLVKRYNLKEQSP